MTFNQLFFKKRNGQTFFETNTSTDQTARASWLQQFPDGNEHKKKLEIMLRGNIWLSAGRVKRVHLVSSQESGGGYVTTKITQRATVSISYCLPMPGELLAWQLCELNELTKEQNEKVDVQYKQIMSEAIDSLIKNESLDRKANAGLLAFCERELADKFLKIKHLDTENMSFANFEKDANEYQQELNGLINEFCTSRLFKQHMLNMYLFLVYQENHPDIFTELFKEKFVRYLSKTLVVLSLIVIYSVTALLAILSMVLITIPLSLTLPLGITILTTIAATLPFIAIIWGVVSSSSYVKNNTEYNTINAGIWNTLKQSYLHVFEWIFGCKTHEFEMMRVLEKGKNFAGFFNQAEFKNPDEVPEAAIEDTHCAARKLG